MKDYTRDSDGSIDGLDLRASYDSASRKYFLFSVNESSSSVDITVDTSAWNISIDNRVLLEEVSENRHGSGRNWGSVTDDKTLFPGSVNVWQQPGNTVWLWTIPSKAQQAEETVTVAEDAMVKDGYNAGTNYGSATSLLARNDPTNSANRSAAFLKFNIPPIYLPDIQLGSSTITVSVSDGALTASDTFLVTVTGTASESWRVANFGTAANSGNAADTFDANHDGEINLLEFATAQDPHASNRAVLTAIRTASALEITYTRSKAAFAGGVTFTVEWSDTLAPDSWSDALVTQDILTDTGTIQTVKATVPAAPAIPIRHARLKVTQAP